MAPYQPLATTLKENLMIIKVDEEIVLKQLEKSDSIDIFKTIDTQRNYLGKWLPFVEFTNEISDTESFVNTIVDAPVEKFEYVFAIKKCGEFVGLIGFQKPKFMMLVAD